MESGQRGSPTPRSPAHHRRAGVGAGKAVLTPTDAGSRLEFTATVEVDIPFVGGKIRDFLGGKLAELVIAEQRFTTAWIAENA